MDFFQAHYWKDESWRQIDGAWLTEAADLALQLDSATNNTSLVIAIELEDGDVLLFAGDAQVGNWLSWQKLKWTVEGREVSGPSLLRKTIFYKVGHHGSRNATLRQLGLEQMDRLKVAAIPVNEEMAKKKGWGHMPSKPLVSALNQKTNGFVLRSDADAPATALNTTSDKLFFEVNL
jgi:beta-lactamase superfamily II metal-dependent hydrolase